MSKFSDQGVVLRWDARQGFRLVLDALLDVIPKSDDF